jgi:hypothetical protein
MKNFLLVYRTDYSTLAIGTPDIPVGTPEEIAAMTKRWMDWMAGIAAQDKLTDRGNRLATSGKVVKADNVVTNGPYSEIKESIGGYSVVKANSYEEAVELAKSCPILTVGGNVEVREISVL